MLFWGLQLKIAISEYNSKHPTFNHGSIFGGAIFNLNSYAIIFTTFTYSHDNTEGDENHGEQQILKLDPHR